MPVYWTTEAEHGRTLLLRQLVEAQHQITKALDAAKLQVGSTYLVKANGELYAISLPADGGALRVRKALVHGG